MTNNSKETLLKARVEVTKAIGTATDNCKPYSRDRSARVLMVALQLARRIGINGRQMQAVELGSMLHDVGILAIPAGILTKSGPLSDDEWRIVRAHPLVGSKIVREIGFARTVAPIVLHHHERYDGQGYPSGLKGHSIPLPARIIAIADAYCAMTSPQAYREALPLDHARAEIIRNASTQFDPEVVRVFLETEILTETPLPQHDLQHPATKGHAPPAVRPNASGYVPKWVSRDSLVAAVKLAEMRGSSPVEVKLLTELLRDLGGNGNAPAGSTAGTLTSLSPRERQVLRMLADGLRNKEIAIQICCSLGTVKNTVQHIIEKLGVSDRTQAAVVAVREGLQPN
jgi:DNA-binding CsgD family transcriptional regulator